MKPLPPHTYPLSFDVAEHTAQKLLAEWMRLSTQIDEKLTAGDLEAINQLIMRRGQCLQALKQYFRGQGISSDEMATANAALKNYATVDQQLKDKVQSQMALLRQKMGNLGQSRQQVGRYKQTLKSPSHTRGFA